MTSQQQSHLVTVFFSQTAIAYHHCVSSMRNLTVRLFTAGTEGFKESPSVSSIRDTVDDRVYGGIDKN